MKKNKPPAPEAGPPGAAVFWLAVAVLAAALLFGGGARRDLLSDFVPQILSLFLLWAAGPDALERLKKERLLLVALVAVVLLPIAQLIPAPAAILAILPGRDEVYAPLMQAGVASAGSISLRPQETLRSAAALLPGLSLLAAALVLSGRDRRLLVLLAIAVALASVPLGMLQVLGGPSSALYFYANTNAGRAVGFFANANHYSAFFYVVLPFCVAFAVSDRKVGGVSFAQVGLAAAAVLILGLALSGSRTVLLLGPLSFLVSYLWFGRGIMTYAFGPRYRFAGVLAGLALMAPLALGVGVLTILGRLETQDFADDLRWTMTATTWRAAVQFFPIGAGLGAFERVYAYFEPLPSVVALIINHAHNDWLELLLETGAFAIVFALLVIVWLIRNAARPRAGWEALDDRLARAAVVAVSLVVIHSFWDYPARTIAIATLLGLGAGLTVAPLTPGGEISLRLRRRRRRRTRRVRETNPQGTVSGGL